MHVYSNDKKTSLYITDITVIKDRVLFPPISFKVMTSRMDPFLFFCIDINQTRP